MRKIARRVQSSLTAFGFFLSLGAMRPDIVAAPILVSGPEGSGCYQCSDTTDGFGNVYHYFFSGSSYFTNPHAGSAWGWCAGSHTYCGVGLEEFDRTVAEELASVDATPATLRALVAQGKGQLRVDLATNTLTLYSCTGELYRVYNLSAQQVQALAA